MDLGGIGATFSGFLNSAIVWVVIAAVFVGVVFGFLFMKRKFSFKFPCIEVIGVGQSKIMAEISKAGWFKKKRAFFGLLEIGGEQEMRIKSGYRKIQQVSSQDYHDINGKRGLFVKRKDDDPSVLVPLSKFQIMNETLLSEIAPADYRDAAIDILDEKRKETLTWWDENKSTILLAGVIIFALISLIVIFNFAKGESTAWREFAAGRNLVQQVSTAP